MHKINPGMFDQVFVEQHKELPARLVKNTTPERNEAKRVYNKNRRAMMTKEERDKERGSQPQRKTKCEKSEFIALDGEGYTYGEALEVERPDGVKISAAPHYYWLLAASSGESISKKNIGERLRDIECAHFLCDLAQDHPHAIFVSYFFRYDVEQMFAYEIEPEGWKELNEGRAIELHDTARDQWIDIQYRKKKELNIRRSHVGGWQWKRVGDRNVRLVESSIRIWDVQGFFQSSFLVAMEQWLGKDDYRFETIKRMKAARSDFTPAQFQEVIDYNNFELSALVDMMNKLRDAAGACDLVLKRWDGAGALAAAIYTKYKIADRKPRTGYTEELFDAFRRAFAGGRIECIQYGVTTKAVHSADIASAYPAAQRLLPDLAPSAGEWMHGRCEADRYKIGRDPRTFASAELIEEAFQPDAFTIVHVNYCFKDAPFYPLFYRKEHGSILFPQSGRGWYWLPEILAAQKLAGGRLDILEFYYWRRDANAVRYPFDFINEYFSFRQRLVASIRSGSAEGWEKGAQLTIKLGINSLYGKTAQQIGGEQIRKGSDRDKTQMLEGCLIRTPPYFNYAWAGYITGMTRARIYEAAMTDPNAVISMATDGIYSTRKLPLAYDAEKKLGAWEYDADACAGGMISIASGNYVKIKGDGRVVVMSRGYDKTVAAEEFKCIPDAWKRGDGQVEIDDHALVTMGMALISKCLQPLIGRWIKRTKAMNISKPSPEKRRLVPGIQTPWKKLETTDAAINTEFEMSDDPSEESWPASLKFKMLGDEPEEDAPADEGISEDEF